MPASRQLSSALYFIFRVLSKLEAPRLSAYHHTASVISQSFVLTVPKTNRPVTMFTSAVGPFGQAVPTKKNGPVKPSFLSSRPMPIENAFKITSQSSQSLKQHGGRRALTTSSTLRQSAQSMLNEASTIRRNVLSSNSLKRTAHSNGLPYNPTCGVGKQPPSVSPVATTHDSSISKLHDSVYFDENDIDSSSDLLADSPPCKTTTPKPWVEPTLPANSEVNTEVPDSSAAFPWSSSPVEHRLPPQQIAGGKGNQLVVVASSTADGNTHKRTVPWKVEDAADDQQEVGESSRGLALGTAAEGRRPKRIRSDGHSPSVTRPIPLPKDNANSNPHPWNKTASDVKEEQKRLRQINKRLVKTNEATEEDKAKAIAEKKKRNVIKVFLSDEQRHVEHLVVEKGKSVFFTGSAGIPSSSDSFCHV
jgi:hypothetical protein